MALSKEDLKLSIFTVSGNDLVSNAIYESIRCKTYPTLPRKIDDIVYKLTELYEREFERISSNFYLKRFKTYDELHSWLNINVKSISEIQELNLSQNEYDARVSVDDPDRPKYIFASRYSKPCDPNDDFIDLDAYIGNLTQNLIRENIDINYSTF